MKFIMKSNPNLNEYDSSIIKRLENKIKDGDALTEDEVDIFLENICIKTRQLISNNINEDDYNGKDLLAASIISNYLYDLGINHHVCSTKHLLDKGVIDNHFVIMDLNTDLYGNSVKMEYLLDPTYRQFFTHDKCNPDYEITKHDVIIRSPDPGYFIHPYDIEEIEYFLYNGYSILDPEFAYIYLNSFLSTKTGTKELEMKQISANDAYDILQKGSKCNIISRKELEDKNLLLEPINELIKKM